MLVERWSMDCVFGDWWVLAGTASRIWHTRGPITPKLRNRNLYPCDEELVAQSAINLDLIDRSNHLPTRIRLQFALSLRN